MTEPGFRVDSIRHERPYRARSAFSGYHTFSDGHGAVLVAPPAAAGMREAAGRALPKETGGLLSGRTLRDSQGDYVLVSGFVRAGPGAGRSAAFEISPQETARLREEAYRCDPTGDVVGWWHSHPRPSGYSQTDLNTQAIFTQPDSVGLLVFAQGEPWLTAYMGPKARRLDYQAAMRAPGHAHPTGNGPATVRRPQPDQVVLGGHRTAGPQPVSWPSGGGRSVRRVVVITGCALLLILAVAAAVTLFGLSGQISSEQQQVSSQVSAGQRQLASQVSAARQQLASEIKRAGGPPPAPAYVSYACVPTVGSNGKYSGSITCTATPSVAGKIKWFLDSKHAGTGPTCVLPVPLGSQHTVQAVLETSSGPVPGPTQHLSF